MVSAFGCGYLGRTRVDLKLAAVSHLACFATACFVFPSLPVGPGDIRVSTAPRPNNSAMRKQAEGVTLTTVPHLQLAA
jgi:hypothetical protein